MTAPIDFILTGDPYLSGAGNDNSAFDHGTLIDPDTTLEQQLAFAGLQLGSIVGKLGLMVATDTKTGEKKAVIAALPPAELPSEPPIPLAVLIDGDPYEQYAPGHGWIDLDVYRAATRARQAA